MFHERLRAARMNRGMSQVELAKKLSVTKQSVSNWENDNILPSIEMLCRIAACLSVSTDYLVGLDDRKTLDVTDLDERTVAHLQLLIDDIRSEQ